MKKKAHLYIQEHLMFYTHFRVLYMDQIDLLNYSYLTGLCITTKKISLEITRQKNVIMDIQYMQFPNFSA